MGKRDKLMLSIDSAIMGVSNIITRFIPSKSRTEIWRNRDLIKSENDICFVIGNGPSLTQEQLDRISSYDTINVNFFYNNTMKFNGKYLLFVDPGFANETGIEYVKNCLKKNKDLIIITDFTNYIYIKRYCNVQNNQLFCIDISLKQHSMFVATDITRQMTGSVNVIPVAIELAIGMGYSKIYLLGCDFSLYGSKNAGRHFYDKNVEYDRPRDYEVGNLIRCALVHQHHIALENYCREKKILIKNLTPDSFIQAYDFDTLQHFA